MFFALAVSDRWQSRFIPLTHQCRLLCLCRCCLLSFFLRRRVRTFPVSSWICCNRLSLHLYFLVHVIFPFDLIPREAGASLVLLYWHGMGVDGPLASAMGFILLWDYRCMRLLHGLQMYRLVHPASLLVRSHDHFVPLAHIFRAVRHLVSKKIVEFIILVINEVLLHW